VFQLTRVGGEKTKRGRENDEKGPNLKRSSQKGFGGKSSDKNTGVQQKRRPVGKRKKKTQ